MGGIPQELWGKALRPGSFSTACASLRAEPSQAAGGGELEDPKRGTLLHFVRETIDSFR